MRNLTGPPTLSFRSANLVDMFRRIRQTGATSAFLRREEAFRQEVALRTREFARSFPQPMEPFWIDTPPGEDSDLPIDLDDNVPMQLDLSATGFRTPDMTRPVLSYQRPIPPAEGFTRIAKEDEIVVCPNCDHELGTGDDPVKRQIWVAKPCGHVYCGQCTKHRALSRGKKPEQPIIPKTKPFAKCVVSECGKSVSQPKAMFQIYL